MTGLLQTGRLTWEAKDNFESFVQNIINEIILFEPIMKGLEAKSCVFRINRDIRFSNDKSPYKSHFGAFIVRGGKKNGNNIFASVGIHTSERDERHILQKIDGVDKDIQESASEQETQLDNVARRTSLRGVFSMPVSSNDFISFESSAGILRYDTPDSTNTDDRDDFYYSGW